MSNHLTGFEVFQYYIALKLHFNTEYDFHKYHAKAKVIAPKYYHKRNDKRIFEILAEKYTKEEIVSVLLASIADNNTLWIGDLLTDYVWVKETYDKWKAKMDRLEYVYETDLKYLIQYVKNHNLAFVDLFRYNATVHPIIFRLVLEGEIESETFIILNQLFQFVKPLDDLIWTTEIKRLNKYASFLHYDIERMNKKTRQILTTANKPTRQ